MEDKKAIGYILDLRSNPDGLLYASIDIAQMFINEGKIVSTVDRQGGTKHSEANKTALKERDSIGTLKDPQFVKALEILQGKISEAAK